MPDSQFLQTAIVSPANCRCRARPFPPTTSASSMSRQARPLHPLPSHISCPRAQCFAEAIGPSVGRCRWFASGIGPVLLHDSRRLHKRVSPRLRLCGGAHIIPAYLVTPLARHFRRPNGCGALQPCEYRYGICASGTAGGLVDPPHNLFCGSDLPVGATPNG